MNARTSNIEIACEGNQVYDVVSSLFHTILLHRSHGKFNYTNESAYSVGTLGYEEIVCDFVDFTYVRCASPSLVESVNKEIRNFVQRLRSEENPVGSIFLEFVTKKRQRWSLVADDAIRWEIWTLRVEGGLHTAIEDLMLEKMLNIIQVMNSTTYLPQMPTQQMISSVFDSRFTDVQPYLHNIGFSFDNSGNSQSNPRGTVIREVVKTILKS